MNKVLVKWHDWKDDEKFEGFKILDYKEWRIQKQKIEKITEPFEVCLSSENFITYPNGIKFLSHLHVYELDNFESEVIMKYFYDSYGFYNFLDDVDYYSQR